MRAAGQSEAAKGRTRPRPADGSTSSEENLVPLLAFRILASAKREILEYLEGKGLRYATVCPDLGGSFKI